MKIIFETLPKIIENFSFSLFKLLIAAPVLCVVIFSYTAASNAFAQAATSQNETLFIKNVTVIDMKSSKPKAAMDVLISGGRISALEKTGKVKPPANVKVIDGSGKYLIPGLWDMHTHHWVRELFHPLYLANGITGIRDMGDALPQLKAWRQDIESGKSLGPRMVFAGQILDGLNWGSLPHFSKVETEAEGRQKVRDFTKDGVDFIKVYSHLSRESYFAIVDEAKKLGIPFAGHVPYEVSALEASRTGQRSIEHLTGVVQASSSREQELANQIKSIMNELRQVNPTEAQEGANNPRYYPVKSFGLTRRAYDLSRIEALDFYDEKKAAKLFREFVKNETWQVPTLNVMGGNESRDDFKSLADARLKYYPSYIRELIVPSKVPTADELALSKARTATQFKVVRQMNLAGVKLLAGSDAPNAFSFPGFSLHDELELLVRAGLSPYEALKTATCNPAEFFGKTKELGTIEKGKLADLVLLDANPLENIVNTQRINSVFANGNYLSRQTLDATLAEMERNNRANK